MWREFPTGPTGVFLKRGRDITAWGLMLRPPFFWTTTVAGSGSDAALLRQVVHLLRVRRPVRARVRHQRLSVLPRHPAGAGGVVRIPVPPRAHACHAGCALGGRLPDGSVVPVYFVWIAPELFNFSSASWRISAGSTRRSRRRSARRRGLRWLLGGTQRLIAAVLLGIVTFSKVTNALLFPPVVLWQIWRRQWRRAIVSSALFALVAGGLFAINTAISGEWNYQGGHDRSTFHAEFPLQTPQSGFDVGRRRSATKRSPTSSSIGASSGRTSRTTSATSSSAAFAGIGAYFFPAVFALAGFVIAFRRRPAWQYLVVAAAVGQLLVFIVLTPYTWNGGGGSVGNRYFMSAYGIFFFILAGDCSRRRRVRAVDRGRAVHRADRAQPVPLVVLSGRLRQGRAAAAGCRWS